MCDGNNAAPPSSTSQQPDFLAWCAAASKLLLRQRLHQLRAAPATSLARSDGAHAAPGTPAASWREREATPSTSAYSSFESNKLEDSTLCTEDNEEIEVEKEMAEDEEDS